MNPRARDLGNPFDGETGAFNAITDIPGVAVGHETIIRGDPPLEVGIGPVRTGVTAIWPVGKDATEAVAASTFSLNGNGEMTGTAFIEEFGLLFGPILLTNTHSVGAVHEAAIKYLIGLKRPLPWVLPCVAETYDGRINDINGFHVREEHVLSALNSATGGQVAEGNVGGGTGMIAYGFKGGIGTSSREVGEHTVGVLVQANHGSRQQLRIAGLPVGLQIDENPLKPSLSSSIIAVVGTDAPLQPLQLKALCKRAALGLGRTGAVADMSSGDLFIAFSTANRMDSMDSQFSIGSVAPRQFSLLYEAAAQACEEAIINALVAAETVTDVQGDTVMALPHERIRGFFRAVGNDS